MGLPSPTFYDQLLLEKCKALILNAIQNPNRVGGVTSYEQFCRDLDIHHASSTRAFDSMLHETTIRKPSSSGSGLGASSSSASSNATVLPGHANAARLRRSRMNIYGSGGGRQPYVEVETDSDDSEFLEMDRNERRTYQLDSARAARNIALRSTRMREDSTEAMLAEQLRAELRNGRRDREAREANRGDREADRAIQSVRERLLSSRRRNLLLGQPPTPPSIEANPPSTRTAVPTQPSVLGLILDHLRPSLSTSTARVPNFAALLNHLNNESYTADGPDQQAEFGRLRVTSPNGLLAEIERRNPSWNGLALLRSIITGNEASAAPVVDVEVAVGEELEGIWAASDDNLAATNSAFREVFAARYQPDTNDEIEIESEDEAVPRVSSSRLSIPSRSFYTNGFTNTGFTSHATEARIRARQRREEESEPRVPQDIRSLARTPTDSRSSRTRALMNAYELIARASSETVEGEGASAVASTSASTSTSTSTPRSIFSPGETATTTPADDDEESFASGCMPSPSDELVGAEGASRTLTSAEMAEAAVREARLIRGLPSRALAAAASSNSTAATSLNEARPVDIPSVIIEGEQLEDEDDDPYGFDVSVDGGDWWWMGMPAGV